MKYLCDGVETILLCSSRDTKLSELGHKILGTSEGISAWFIEIVIIDISLLTRAVGVPQLFELFKIAVCIVHVSPVPVRRDLCKT